MNLQLRDKVVLITGGAKGIGAATAQALGQEGAVPVIVDRDTEAGEKLCTELSRTGVRYSLISSELTSARSCSQAVKQTFKEHGQLDALINNAGVNDRVGLEEGSPEQYLASSASKSASLLRHGAL